MVLNELIFLQITHALFVRKASRARHCFIVMRKSTMIRTFQGKNNLNSLIKLACNYRVNFLPIRYQCEQCDRVYLNQNDRDKHQLTHTKNRP